MANKKRRGAKLNPIIITGFILIGLMLVILALTMADKKIGGKLKAQVASSSPISCAEQKKAFPQGNVTGYGSNRDASAARNAALQDAVTKIQAAFNSNLGNISAQGESEVPECVMGCSQLGSVSCALTTPARTSCTFSTTKTVYGYNATATCPWVVNCTRTCEPDETQAPGSLTRCDYDSASKTCSEAQYWMTFKATGSGSSKTAARADATAKMKCDEAVGLMAGADCANSPCMADGAPDCKIDSTNTSCNYSNPDPVTGSVAASCKYKCDCTRKCKAETTPSPLPSVIPSVRPDDTPTPDPTESNEPQPTDSGSF